MDITYQEEKFEDILEEVKPMFKQHWEELAINKDVRPLDPDYSAYIVLSGLQILRMFTVRLDKKIVGYSIWFVNKHMHYKTWLFASSDVYWLHPDQRKTGISFDFFFKIEDWMKSIGVKSIIIQDKLEHSHAKFFNQLGYKPIEQNYEKVI